MRIPSDTEVQTVTLLPQWSVTARQHVSKCMHAADNGNTSLIATADWLDLCMEPGLMHHLLFLSTRSWGLPQKLS